MSEYNSSFYRYDIYFRKAYLSENNKRISSILEDELSAKSSFHFHNKDKYSWDLHKAIRMNDIDMAHSLIEREQGDARIRVERNHVFIAAILPTRDMLDKLLEFDNQYFTRANHLMMHAIESSDMDLLRYALEKNANPNEWKGKAFFSNASIISKDIMTLLLEFGFKPSSLSSGRYRQFLTLLSGIFQHNLSFLPDGPYLYESEFSDIVTYFMRNSEWSPIDLLPNVSSHFRPALLKLMSEM